MNPDGVEKEKRKNSNRNKGCWLFIFALSLLMCFCGVIIWILPMLGFYANQSKWIDKKPTVYTAEIWVVGVPHYQMEIEEDPIDYMFERAYTCEINFPENLFCSVAYDETYGYPQIVGVGILNYTHIQVSNFQVLED